MRPALLPRPKPESIGHAKYLEALAEEFQTPLIRDENHFVQIPGFLLHLNIGRVLPFLRDGAKGLDLGCSNGFQLAAYTFEGLSMYGIDRSPRMVAEAHEILKEFGISPQIIQDDYFTLDFQKARFPDGTRIQDIDFYTCYPFDPPFTEDVMFNVLTRSEVKIGAYVIGLMPHIGGPYGEFLHKSGFRCIPDSRNLYRKAEESTLDLDQVNRYLADMCGYRRPGPID